MNTITKYRHGEVILQRFAIDPDLRYEPGDLLFWDSGDSVVKPASAFTWNTNIATTQADFAALFVGICWEGHDETALNADNHTVISVDVSSESVYEFSVDSATYGPMAYLGVTNGGSGTTVLDTTLKSALQAAAIARPFETKSGTITTLRVTFAPAFRTNSSNYNALIGGEAPAS